MKIGYKKTKLGWLPEDWRYIKLGDIAEFSKGKGISKNDIALNGLRPCIRYGELYTTYGEIIEVVHSYTNLEENELVFSKGNDVIIPASGESALDIATASCVVKNGIALGGDLNVIRTNENGIFLSYYLNTIKRNEIAKLAQGISVVHIYAHQLKSIKIAVPELPEQLKIVSILSAWDNAIRTRQILIDKLKTRKKGLIQSLLTRNLRLDGFSEEWKEFKFGDLITERKQFSSEPLPLCSLTIESGVVPKSKRYERSFLLKSTKDAYKTMHQNDFALNPMNLRFGAIAKYKEEQRVCVSRYYNIFYFNDSCNSTYMEYYLSSYDMVQYYNKMAIGTLEEKKRVHYSDFVNFKKALPDLSEQNAIVEVLQTADQEIEYYEKYLVQLQAQKKGLMQQLLTGQIRVKV